MPPDFLLSASDHQEFSRELPSRKQLQSWSVCRDRKRTTEREREKLFRPACIVWLYGHRRSDSGYSTAQHVHAEASLSVALSSDERVGCAVLPVVPEVAEERRHYCALLS